MVLGYKMKNKFTLFFFLLPPSIFLFSSCVAATNEVEISGIKLSLNNCELNYEYDGIKEKRILVLTDNCHFHKNRTGEPRVEFVHGKFVVLIERSIPHPKQNVDSFYKGKCDTELLGIVVNNNKVNIRKTSVKVLGCSGLMWDKKIFSSFAESSEK